mmetsp:Transcript_11224/g.16263  ORF Transcript_11224/g.16263 Transcript_11224/m.16263 type:complete len:256 (-) Transcript_11224:138-905(-)
MSKLSQCFSKRMVKKSYIALAFREAFNNDDEKFQTSMNNMIDEDDSSQQIDDYINKTSSSSMGTIQSKSDDIQGEEGVWSSCKWNIIDYPIDGKDATTSWRIIRNCIVSPQSSLESSNPQYILSLLALRPSTGRYHQIRRHLAYCIENPIVGDNKYDGGGEFAQSLRSKGMFLCSNALEFPYPLKSVERNGLITSSNDERYGSGVIHDDFWLDVSKNISSDCGNSCRFYVSNDDEEEFPMMRIIIPLPKKFTDMI